MCTERKVVTWQSFPELNVEPGDFTSDAANIDTAPSTTSNNIVREMSILRVLVTWSHITKIQ